MKSKLCELSQGLSGLTPNEFAARTDQGQPNSTYRCRKVQVGDQVTRDLTIPQSLLPFAIGGFLHRRFWSCPAWLHVVTTLRSNTVGGKRAMCDLTNPAFTDEDKAREFLKAIRWPVGPGCLFCGQQETVSKLGGKSMRLGWYYCSGDRDKFTVRVGTLYECSHIPLHKGLFATHLMVSSKKGMSALQLSRLLCITYGSSWSMCHRIREAVTSAKPGSISSENKIVESDEAVICGKAKNSAYAKKYLLELGIEPCVE
jgi:transposase-like protein